MPGPKGENDMIIDDRAGNAKNQTDIVEAKIRSSIVAWNGLTNAERATALDAAKTAVPAQAMRHMGWDIPESLPLQLDGNSQV